MNVTPIDKRKTEGPVMPRHIAIVMDGNGRWAKKRLLPRTAGHKAGVKATRKVVELCVARRIETLTLFAFSSENWKRPEQEVSSLMSLFISTLQSEIQSLHKQNVRVRFIGDCRAFAEKLQAKIAQAERLTAENTGLQLNIAVNYGGRWDIAQACKAVAQQVLEQKISLDDISAELVDGFLSLAELPDPDLFIRTGGEHRISNFLMWQLAYSELYFCDELWPEFNEQAFDRAIESFAGRQRRFGQTGEQIETKNHG
ncbi:MAG: isoprenyl transferase [Gammaproteobacteria bacterium]|nr:isoprenyl transferase [Gammaproteobacteria bacterium]